MKRRGESTTRALGQSRVDEGGSFVRPATREQETARCPAHLAGLVRRDRHRELILELNAKLNALLDAEGAAEEDGAH